MDWGALYMLTGFIAFLVTALLVARIITNHDYRMRQLDNQQEITKADQAHQHELNLDIHRQSPA